MVESRLEKSVEQRVQPIVDNAINRAIGISLPSLTSDIADRLKHEPHFKINTLIPFKQAKRDFKKQFLQKLLSTFGNITEVSKMAGLKRESVHRLIKQLNVEQNGDFRHYMKKEAIKGIIADCVETYKHALHPERVIEMYDGIPQLTEDIIDELPEDNKSLSEAEEEFEKEYIKQALKENGRNISKTARKIGLRFETLHRKMKKLEL